MRWTRRSAMTGLSAAVWCGPLLGPASPQDAGPRRIGILMPYPASDRAVAARVGGFREEMLRLGWGAGTLTFVEHWTGDNLSEVRRAAAELVAAGVDVILTTGSRVVPILQQATARIPIVFTGISDPVGQKLVASLARPGGNTTGNSVLEFVDGRSPLMAKQLDLLLQLAPAASTVALLFNPENPAAAIHAPTFMSASAAAGRQAVLLPVRTAGDIEASLASLAAKPGSAVAMPSDLTLLAQRELIVRTANRLRIPAIYSDDEFVEIGGLAAYAADRDMLFRRAAGYVDRILRGESPASMPVEQPTKYDFSLNLKTARAIDATVPPTLLALADTIIE